jgi:septum formation protein
LGKPANKADARRMLRALSGRTHEVISGVCLLRKPGGRKLLAAETTRVKFRRLSRQEIEDYVSTREPYDKAGAYAIQGRAGFFVERIEGDYFNVVGLPVALILCLLRKAGRRRAVCGKR